MPFEKSLRSYSLSTCDLNETTDVNNCYGSEIARRYYSCKYVARHLFTYKLFHL